MDKQCKTMKKYSKEIISFLLLLAGIVMQSEGVEWFRASGVRLVWYAAAYLLVGWPVLKEAFESFREKDFFNEFTLMSIASLGAFYIGEFPEGVAVMLFYSVGELFQEIAVGKARSNIRALLDLRPETATVIRNDRPVIENPQEVLVGEVIEVKPGERVPLDGTLQTATASFDTAALTGESIPRTISSGEEVLAGMIATDKMVRLRITRPYNQSALARILEMVQEASERKAPAELFIRKFARIYTPAVALLAVLIVLLPFLYSLMLPGFTFVFNDWLYRALVFLVVSCPCALVVSIPLGYFGGIGAASSQGILFKGGNYLDAITKVNAVVFDKTGTLTEGAFDVEEVVPALGVPAAELLQTVASAELNSTHPIAKAIVKYAQREGLVLMPPREVTELAGYGLSVRPDEPDGRHVLVGNARLLEQQGISFPQGITSIPETIVACAVDGKYLGYLLLADTPRADAQRAVDELRKLGIDTIQILSGDKPAIVLRLADRLGIKEAYGDLLPEGKVKHIEELKSDPRRRVAFVGDGINDAPVLALSDVGIAMGGLGSDAAIETADVVIQTDQPSKIATAIRIARQTRRVVWQNIAMAFAVKVAVLLLAAVGLASMWGAVFADVGVALLAILNAVRIQKGLFWINPLSRP